MPGRLIMMALVALMPVFLLAQGHRGMNEPALNQALMELPAIKNSDVVLVYNGFIINYNTEWLVPNWVAYELTANETDGEVPRTKRFTIDMEYKERQAMQEDYSNTGWDKGHMAPAGDMKWSQIAMNESFYLTNICPQNHDLNNKDWHTLEKHVRDWAAKYGSVWVVCGPYLYANTYGTIGERKVIVPDGFFKAVLRKDGNSYKSIAFVFENGSNPQPLKHAMVSVNDVEALVGFDLFTNLNDRIEETVEAQSNWEEWE